MQKRKSLILRRLTYAVLVIGTTGLACTAMWSIIAPMGVTASESAMLFLFTANFMWIALWFWSAMLGFIISCSAQKPNSFASPLLERLDRELPIKGRTAIIIPICNEDPERVLTRFEATYRSAKEANLTENIEFFLLSDTYDTSIAQQEVDAVNKVKDRFCCKNLHYRRRTENSGRKAGNIADFGRQWGDAFEYFIVLDADSIMSGSTIGDLIRLMNTSPEIGVIQTVPRLVLGQTLFSRFQQFSARLTSEVMSLGTAFWQQHDANFFGHNAIIRSEPFFAHCKLPILSRSGPLSGEILSHDFVEAAYMQRAGYYVYSLPVSEGSYEEVPQTLVEYETRDRRWCKGNLQHLNILTENGLRPISRLHLASGIMSYLSAPLWLAFIMASLWNLIERENPNFLYLGPGSGSFSVIPSTINESAVLLFLAIMGMFVLPRLVSLSLILIDGDERKGYGGSISLVLSTLADIVTSIILAPVLMISQVWYIISILFGKRIDWPSQGRDLQALKWKTCFFTQGGTSFVGFAFLIFLLCFAPTSLSWAAPLLLGPILAPAIAFFSAHKHAPSSAFKTLFQTPEERFPPNEIASLMNISD